MSKRILVVEDQPDIFCEAACCARTAIGHAAAPPTRVMNSRRLMGSPLGLRLNLTTTWNDAGASQQNWLLLSEMGHKRTWRLQFAMSALHSIADIHCGNRNVYFGPMGEVISFRNQSRETS
jgi:hypothetical protein